VFGDLVAGIAGSNPTEGMDVGLLCLYFVLSSVSRGLCDGLIAHPEESTVCLILCGKETSIQRRPNLKYGL
jgi:hypothetical protein